MGTVQERIEELQKNYKPNDHVAVAIWSIEDVITRAKERKISVTKKQAENILDDIEDHHEATLGINWDTIDSKLDEL